MNDVAAELNTLVDEVTPILARMPAHACASRAHPDAWSKKEILGHLIDSATNNHQRFVRAACHPTVVTHHIYDQNAWVSIQQYHKADWDVLVMVWSAYNRHLCAVINHLPAEVLAAPCDIGKPEPVSLAFVIRDYLRHVRHHIEELLPDRTEATRA